MRELLAGAVLAVASAGSWAQTAFDGYSFYLIPDSREVDGLSSEFGGQLTSLTPCSTGICGNVLVFDYFLADAYGTATNILFDGATPKSFIGSATGAEMEDVILAGIGRGTRYRVSSFAATGARFSFEAQQYFFVNGQRIDRPSINTTGSIVFDRVFAPIPEPSTYALLGLGSMALLLRRKFTSNQPSAATADRPAG